MPPRHAYWTILIDQKPTAFRARDREELLPTFGQLHKGIADVVLKWFVRGRRGDSPDQAAWTLEHVERKAAAKRGGNWRPGGQHEDTRARFRARARSRPNSPNAARE